jgi:hypothetical protein
MTLASASKSLNVPIKMIIKKHKNKNEYLLTTEKFWVRNFTKINAPSININQLTNFDDYKIFLENELKNSQKKYPWIDTENLIHDKIAIISDGLEFENKTDFIKILQSLNVTTIGVNGSLKKWNNNKSLNYYVINNPYPEAMHFFPKRNNFPKCIASIRTNWEFLERYKGIKYKYYPSIEPAYTGTISKEIDYQIDDYRNPICAAINLSYRFNAKKILLLCCDNSFKENRAGSMKISDDVFMYPQHKTVHSLIDANLFWLKGNIEAKNHSKNLEYKNASYIDEEGTINFFSN